MKAQTPKDDKRVVIFKQLRKLLKKYEPPFTAKSDFDSRYELWSIKDVTFAGRKRKEVFFAGLIIQSTYVGFYYMPVYTDPAIKKMFKKELLSTLKGKSCFHITRMDALLLEQVRSALELGYKMYKTNGWV
ncbi:MAG: hypothetical protein H6Q31_2188 [Bacteroidetes bacterium]|nr:hypothetical protein [Bacteroidota bacterium]